jgi:hypothetical protein
MSLQSAPSRPLYRLPGGVWPAAARELAEALQTLGTPAYSAFSAFRRRAVPESRLNPAASRYLSPRNRKIPRPALYLSLYVNVRNTLVLDFWAHPLGCFLHEGFPVSAELWSEGDFYSFERYGNGCARPTNRALHLPLSRGLAQSLKAKQPWTVKTQPEFSLLRHVCALLVRDKLHRLSQQFDCHLSRELLEYGDDHFVELRDLADVHKAQGLPEDPYFGLDEWMPDSLRNRVCQSRSTFETYAFASGYLKGLPAASRLSALRSYLANAHDADITEYDVAQLLRLSDVETRVSERLQALKTDSPRFEREALGHASWFDCFRASCGLETEDVLRWTLQHHPRALYPETLPPDELKLALEIGHELHVAPRVLENLDRKLAEHVKRFRMTQAHTKQSFNAFARGFGFTRFQGFRQWAAEYTRITATLCDALEVPRAQPRARSRDTGVVAVTSVQGR